MDITITLGQMLCGGPISSSRGGQPERDRSHLHSIQQLGEIRDKMNGLLQRGRFAELAGGGAVGLDRVEASGRGVVLNVSCVVERHPGLARR